MEGASTAGEQLMTQSADSPLPDPQTQRLISEDSKAKNKTDLKEQDSLTKGPPKIEGTRDKSAPPIRRKMMQKPMATSPESAHTMSRRQSSNTQWYVELDPHEVETLSSVDLASRQPAPIEEKPQPEQHSQEPEDLLSSRSVAEKARHFDLKVEEVSNESSSRRTKPIDLPGTPTRTIAIQTEKDSSVRREGKSKLPIVRWNTLESSTPGLGASPSFQRSTSIPDGQVRPRFDITPRPKAPRGSLRREKSIQQRREDERHIQKSRELSNSYELSSDLKNKQVEMLEKRYGGRIRAHHAAKVIQEAFRQHNMKKEFQRLRRTPSESRISRYLDSHSKQWGIGGSRARVMVIGSSGPTSPVSTKTPLKGIQELGAVEQLRGIETVGAEKKKHKVHHNNSNNVTPKRGLVVSASPDLKVKADGDASSAEKSRLSSQTVVVTLTMHRQSDESDTCSHTSTDSTPLGSRDDLTARGDNQSSSPANVATTEKTIKMVIQNTELRDGGGRAFSCRLGSPGQVACAKRLPFDDLDQTPQVRDSTKNEPTALTEDIASVDQSEATQIDFKDEIVTGEDVVEVANKVEHEMEQDEPGTVVPAPEEPVMETTFEVSVQEESCASPSTPTGTSSGEVESPLVPAISMENRKTVVSKAVIKEGKASPSTKRAKKSPKSKNGEDISPKKKNWPFSRSKSGDRTRKGSPTNSPKPQRHNPRASVQRESTESVQKQPSSSEEVHEGNVQGKLHVDSPLQYRKSSSSSTDSQNISIEPKPSITQPNEDPYERPRMHTVGSVEALAKKKSAQESEKMRSNSLSSGDLGDRSDQISLASTVTTSDFDRESMQDVPAVTVATPEGSLTMLDKIISTSSIDSDSDDEDEVHTPCQKRASLPIVSLSGHTASTPPTSASKQLVSRVQSTSGMESPIWKRKSQNTKVATRNGTLVNGTAGVPVPSKTLARSETGDSMSSEGSNSSCRFTVGDDSSITDSLDSLSLESSFMESLEKRPIDPMLSIPMTAVRWRRYRIGLNLFNKKPEKGIKFLVDNKFVENSPNEVAKFLLNRTGLSKAKIGEYLGNLQKEFNMLVLECYVDEMNFRDLCIDEALRKFQTAFRLPGEAQKIERLMEAFAQRYCICNGDVTRAFQKPDTIFILAFAIIMLNTDLHSPNNKPERRMKLQDFLKNLSGIDDGCDIDPELLHGIYNRIRQHPFQPGMDHTSIVFKIEQNITGNRPILAEPHRRVVRDCSLSEVYDPTKKDKKHPRHVFLFNDMLMVTKLYKKKTGSIYGFKKAFPLHTACVLDFSSQYYPHGIRLVAAMNNRTLITFCANSQEEKMKFVADLRETVLEVNEMEDIRIGVYPPREMCPWEAELERQKIVRKSQASTADSGLGLDTESFASTQNLSGSMDSLAPQASDSGTLKRTALSNSLMDLKEASAKKNHRNSASSLDSGVTLDINATMPLPRKNRTGTNPVSSVFSTRRNKVTQPTFDLSTAGNSDTSDS